MKNTRIIGIAVLLLVLAVGYYAIKSYSPVKSPVSVQPTLAPSEQASILLTKEEVAKHTSVQDCWFIIDNAVYNVTEYIGLHPAGPARILSSCGTDATQAFATQGGDGEHPQEAKDQLKLFYIGDLNGRITAQPDMEKIKQIPVEK